MELETNRLQNIGDTKAGTLIGIDNFGNKFFENMEELPLRTRWVDYKTNDWDPYVLPISPAHPFSHRQRHKLTSAPP